MGLHRYTEVDVFSPTPYSGNALAVVHDADGLSAAQMQRFAKWTNLAETTFLLAPTHPEADYRVRIFSTSAELPFAGHPTLGSATAWLRAGGQPRRPGQVVQESDAGLVPVRIEQDTLAFRAPPLTRYGALSESEVGEIAVALGIAREQILDTSWLVNGPEWMGVRLRSAEEVLSLRPSPEKLGTLSIGVVGPYPLGHEAQVEVRAFVGGDPVWEDPVTGSLNAGLGKWLSETGQVGTSYLATQGTVIGCEGRVRVDIDGDEIWVGGQATVCVTGEVRI